MNKSFLYEHNHKTGIVPQNCASGVTGARVKMNDCEKLFILINVGAGTAGTFTFTLKQHTAASSGTTANLSVDNGYYHKLSTATVFTKVENEDSAAAAYTLSTEIGANKAVVAFEVDASQLNVDGGYYWASLDIAAIGQDRICSVDYIKVNSAFKPAYELSV